METIEEKLREILLHTLTSSYDNGNIDDCGICGGNEAIKEIAAYIKGQNRHVAKQSLSNGKLDMAVGKVMGAVAKADRHKRIDAELAVAIVDEVINALYNNKGYQNE